MLLDTACPFFEERKKGFPAKTGLFGDMFIDR
jgi:hypothetical protein